MYIKQYKIYRVYRGRAYRDIHIYVFTYSLLGIDCLLFIVYNRPVFWS